MRGQLWYWRSFLAEFIGLKLARGRFSHLYEGAEKTPLVSVIIPTFDRGKLLVERTLPPIFAQTYQNFEIVIVGDHSADETVEWISQVKDPRMRFYNLPERGKYPKDPLARHRVAGTVPFNKAEELARGKWIAPCEDDDVFTEDHIKSLLRFALEGSYEWVTAAFLEERTPGVLTSSNQPKKNWTLRTRTAASCWLYRSYLRCITCDLNAWRYNMNGDLSRKKRFIRAGVRMGFLENVVTHKLLRPGEKALYDGL